MFDQFRPKRTSTTGTTDQVTLPGVSGAGVFGIHDPVAEACSIILIAAGLTAWPLGKTDQAKVLRKARARTHPDVNSGDQAEWDKVEGAARLLRLA